MDGIGLIRKSIFKIDFALNSSSTLKEPVVKKESKPTLDASKPAQPKPSQAESSFTNDLKKSASGGMKTFNFLF
jgi:hypothetical protein